MVIATKDMQPKYDVKTLIYLLLMCQFSDVQHHRCP